MGLFTKALDKKTDAKPKNKKGTTWVVGGGCNDNVATAIHELAQLSAQEKAIKAKKSLYANQVLGFAKESHVARFCELGLPPDTPMQIKNHDGDQVTFVVQDRGSQYDVKPDQVSALNQLFGEKMVKDDLLYTEATFGLNRVIMSIPGVSEAIEKALEKAVTTLVKNNVLDQDQAEELITVDQKTAFRPGTMDRAAILCGRSPVKLSMFLDAMGSSCCRYVKT